MLLNKKIATKTTAAEKKFRKSHYMRSESALAFAIAMRF